jgi:hypothetical protein
MPLFAKRAPEIIPMLERRECLTKDMVQRRMGQHCRRRERGGSIRPEQPVDIDLRGIDALEEL